MIRTTKLWEEYTTLFESVTKMSDKSKLTNIKQRQTRCARESFSDQTNINLCEIWLVNKNKIKKYFRHSSWAMIKTMFITRKPQCLSAPMPWTIFDDILPDCLCFYYHYFPSAKHS